MAEYIIQEESVVELANAIRKKNIYVDVLESYIQGPLYELEVPDGVTIIPERMFYNRELESVVLPNTLINIGQYAFSVCTSLHTFNLPDNIVSIGHSAFSYTKPIVLDIPAKVSTIDDWAFRNCTELTTVTFKGVPDSVADGVFDNCKNLTTINVPWAEGEVANAPWGATNATINYEYTEV